MADNHPYPTPVADAVQRHITEGDSTKNVIKLSNSTFGRLHTIEKNLPKDSFTLGDVQFADDYLRHASEALEKATKARDEAVEKRDEAVHHLESELEALKVNSAEVKNIQNAVAIILAVIPLVVAGPEIALVAGAASVANSLTRAHAADDLPKTGADASMAAVDAAADKAIEHGLVRQSLLIAKPLTEVVSAGADVWNSESFEGELTSTTDAGFTKLQNEINDSGTFSNKGPALDALNKASGAQMDVNLAEILLKKAQIAYLAALKLAEGVTWVMPR